MEHLQNTKKIPVIVVVGPTASGKTKLSVDLAKHFDGEIVSADSMQIYRYMDIGTAKASCEEQQGIPHHMIDFLDPGVSFSVAEYVDMAGKLVWQIWQKGKIDHKNQFRSLRYRCWNGYVSANFHILAVFATKTDVCDETIP